MKHATCVTLILAGGKGERLGKLTTNISKPSVSFGGAYRLIDFTLSNCVHSRAAKVGVVTQYCHSSLADYIGTGAFWARAGEDGEITTLPPQIRQGRTDRYIGTADAVWKNRDYIDSFNPKNVLVLSGDHIYKMDYSKMLEVHDRSGSNCTIAALQVPLADAPNFGIIQAGAEGRITGFEEKPHIPKSNLASMGVYVFNWPTLKEYLYADSLDPESISDIGGGIIPRMLGFGEKLMAYHFQSYWKDAGSICSLWEAHMDLLAQKPSIDIHDEAWKIISREKAKIYHFEYSRSKDSHIANSIITEGSDIKGTISRSVISTGVTTMKNAVISNAVIMPGAIIGRYAVVHNAIIGANTVVDDYMVIDGMQTRNPLIENNRGIALYTRTPAWKREAQLV